jgi:glucose-6-phosphate isomerase
MKQLGHSALSLSLQDLKGRTGSTHSENVPLAQAWTTLQSRLFHPDSNAGGDVGFYHAPTSEELAQTKNSESLALKLQKEFKLQDVLWIGIGGSALGPIALRDALAPHLADNTPRLHVLENPDADDLQLRLRPLHPASTLIVTATKSGTTFETVALTQACLHWMSTKLSPTEVKKRWVVLTDPSRGDLRSLAETQGLASLPIHPTMGGRFSVFSPVGAFALGLLGRDVRAFFRGAEEVRVALHPSGGEFSEVLGTLTEALLLRESTHPVHVFMPYHSPLRSMALWMVQLWGESLGKQHRGFSPLAALGATDQHSLLQLMREGPDDKITHFLSVAEPTPEKSHRIPKLSSELLGVKTPSTFALLENQSFQFLLHTELEATRSGLRDLGRPSWSIELQDLSERSLGALMYFYALLTALMGTRMGVNPFDQPGVEAGKVFIERALRAGRVTG